MMVSGMAMKTAENGRVSKSDSAAARFCAAFEPLVSPTASLALISGRSTVPSAMPSTPSGKLVDAVGIIERGPAAGFEKTGEHRVDQRRQHDAGRTEGDRAEGDEGIP